MFSRISYPSVKVAFVCLFTFLAASPIECLAFNLATSDESKWSEDEVPVDINASSCPTSVSLATDTERAFDISWNSIASSNLRLVIGNNTTNTSASSGRILIRCASLGASGGAGDTSFSTQSGNIISANIRINSDLDWNSFGGSEAVSFVIGHELGHAIGFSHSDTEHAMMFFSGIREGIAQDDIDAATYLYGRNDLTDGVLGCGSISSADIDNDQGLLQFASLLLFLAAITILLRMRFSNAIESKGHIRS